MRGVSDYHKQVARLRHSAIQRTRGAEQFTSDTLRLAHSQIEEQLRVKNDAAPVSRRLWREKRKSVEAAMGAAAVDLRVDMDQRVRRTVYDVARVRQDAMNSLARANRRRIIQTSFTHIPLFVLEHYSQQVDKEGLLRSPAVWRDNQMDQVDRMVGAAIARGQPYRELARSLEDFMVTPPERRKVGRGVSLDYKAKRLARTEINVRHHEANLVAAQASPVVDFQKWMLSGRHKRWDVCDVFATAGGTGEYPTGKVPPRPHPNCLCYVTDVIRDPADWRKPKDSTVASPRYSPADLFPPGRLRDELEIRDWETIDDVADRVAALSPSERGHITEHFFRQQMELAADLRIDAERSAAKVLQELAQFGAIPPVAPGPPPTAPPAPPPAPTPAPKPPSVPTPPAAKPAKWYSTRELLDATDPKTAQEYLPEKIWITGKRFVYIRSDYVLNKTQRGGRYRVANTAWRDHGLADEVEIKRGLKMPPGTGAEVVGEMEQSWVEAALDLKERYPAYRHLHFKHIAYHTSKQPAGSRAIFAAAHTSRAKMRDRDTIYFNLGVSRQDQRPGNDQIRRMVPKPAHKALVKKANGFTDVVDVPEGTPGLRWTVGGKGADSTARHEIAHHLEGGYTRHLWETEGEQAAKDWVHRGTGLFVDNQSKVSEYANQEWAEFFAESVALYTDPRYPDLPSDEKLSEAVEAFIEEVLSTELE